MTPYTHPTRPPDHSGGGGAHDAVVVAGGAARRFGGGADKPALTVGGRTLLDRALAACADARRTVVVGPRRATYRPVDWAREARPGAGPLAALAAGVRATAPPAAAPTAPPTVLVLGADLPFVRPATGARLRAALAAEPAAEAALAFDGDRDQPLLAAYRREPLERELALLAAEHGRLDQLPLRLLTAALAVHRVPFTAAPGEPPETADCDTWDDLAAARARIREHGRVLDEWMAAVKTELGIDLDVDRDLLLDLARDAAHGVARPAAPLTTFLVGYAAARRGGSAEDVAEAARAAAALAARWAAEEPSPPPAAGPGPLPEPQEPPD